MLMLTLIAPRPLDLPTESILAVSRSKDNALKQIQNIVIRKREGPYLRNVSMH